MTPTEFRAVRSKRGLSTLAMGQALGYRGSDASVAVIVRRFEAGLRPIPPAISILAGCIDRHGVPRDH